MIFNRLDKLFFFDLQKVLIKIKIYLVKIRREETLILTELNLKEIPQEVWKCKNLKYLSLRNNSLEEIPSEISYLRNLSELDLGENLIKYIPEQLFYLPKLKCLNLSDNKLLNISELIDNLERLEYLNISDNKLMNIPTSILNLKNLKFLLLYDNELLSLPNYLDNLLKLKVLDLSGNKLTTLPKSLGNLPNLSILDIEKNEIEQLPSSFDKLSNLQYFQFDREKIKTDKKITDFIYRVNYQNDSSRFSYNRQTGLVEENTDYDPVNYFYLKMRNSYKINKIRFRHLTKKYSFSTQVNKFFENVFLFFLINYILLKININLNNIYDIVKNNDWLELLYALGFSIFILDIIDSLKKYNSLEKIIKSIVWAFVFGLISGYLLKLLEPIFLT